MDEPSPRTPPAGGLRQSRPLAVEPRGSLPRAVVKATAWHPLIYAKRVVHVDRYARPGDMVAVFDVDDNHLGFALFNPRSEITLRIVRRGHDVPDAEYWRRRASEAVRLRRDVLRLDADCDAYRVVHAEADGFSGLAVDRFGPVLSAEVFSLAMYQRVGEVLALLQAELGTTHTLVKPGPATLPQEGFDAEPVWSEGLPDSVLITEFGTRFRVHFEGGHKTGFFCDQRDNRKRVAELAEGRSVLDLCCYTGGFAVQAKKLGKAADVVAIDLDADPLQLARDNANLNQVRVQFVQADAFPYMRDLIANGRKFDLVVLDPPKLIRSRMEYDDGFRKHLDLNRLAMALVKPGGLLLTCSCAGLLQEEDFLQMVVNASQRTGPEAIERAMKFLSVGGAAPDHPVVPQCIETKYLKSAWVQLD